LAAVDDPRLPVHFFTIVLNGEPFIRYHADVFRRLPFRWHWHVVEGVASLVHDTAWSVAVGGHIDPAAHHNGLSVDGTKPYLDELAAEEPKRISLYRKSGAFWDGKREMVAAPLLEIDEECLLWQVDADELWTAEQITSVRRLFIEDPERTAAYYWCDYVPAPGAVIATRYNYAENPAQDWLRTWRYTPGDRWAAHEPPVLVRPSRAGEIEVGKAHPFMHDETEAAGAVFQHFAYATEAQVRFKESYYGYAGAVESWRALQAALRESRGPLLLGDYLPWVTDETLVDLAARRNLRLIAQKSDDGAWTFDSGATETRPRDRSPGRPIVVDGVFFQHGFNTGIARVWRSVLREWIRTGFAERVVFLDRGGAGPRYPGLTTRSIPRWDPERPAEDSFYLDRVCAQERAALLVSTYYTTPLGTPSVMLVYDMIPERLGLDVSDPVWAEKRLAIEHAIAYACISESTRRDLHDLEAHTHGRPATVVLLGVDEHFFAATDADASSFRSAYAVDRPYFMVVGDRRGVGGYKNVRLLFRALRDLPDAADYEVVCVGGAEEVEPELTRLAPKVRTRRFALNDDELRGAYAGALALVFPSRYEGFGLPVAEAMASGCPVITTRLSSLPEVAGDAAIYVDPDDEQALRKALVDVRDPELRATLRARGKARASAFTWSSFAEAFGTLLTDAAMSDTPQLRRMREETWEKRRRTQEVMQRTLASRPRATTVHGVQSPAFMARQMLKSRARRYLPLRVVELLRRVRATTRSHRGRLRRFRAACRIRSRTS
jgi:glycosyltransferase involved in cell wall biosynthesis